MQVKRISSSTRNPRVLAQCKQVSIRSNENDADRNSLLIYSVGSYPHDYEIALSYEQIEILYSQMMIAKESQIKSNWSE